MSGRISIQKMWNFSLSLSQIIVFLILPNSLGTSGANHAKNLLRTAVMAQYIPRLYRFLPLLAGQSPSGFVFETAWANFVINLLTFMLAGHIVGSLWYLFGLQVDFLSLLICFISHLLIFFNSKRYPFFSQFFLQSLKNFYCDFLKQNFQFPPPPPSFKLKHSVRVLIGDMLEIWIEY